jgi:hypothetical protein
MIRPVLLVATLMGLAGIFNGCNKTVYPEADPTFIHNAAVDSIVFWPPALKYARAGDTVSFRVIGFRRVYVCSDIQELGLSWHDDSTHDSYSLHSLVKVPGTPHCAIDPGLDTLFKRIFSTNAGEKLYLKTSAGVSSDSLFFVAGDGFTETFTHLVSGPDSAPVAGRYLFHDSGAGNPKRFLTADSLLACETFQSAAFKRSGDTLTVRFKRLIAVPLAAQDFPPCSGPHADTMEVVLDRFRYP